MGNTLIIILTLIITIIAVAIVLTLWEVAYKAYIRKYRLGIYIDMQKSIDDKTIYFNLINANKHTEFWDVHEDMLRLYASGTLIKSAFYTSADVPTGYKIAYSSNMTSLDMVSLISAFKHDAIEVSHDGGETRTKVHSIHLNDVKKVVSAMAKAPEIDGEAQRRTILKEIFKADNNINESDYAGDRLVSHFHEGRTTSTTMRLQAIIPPHHPLITKLGFNPEVKTSRVYHVYNGKCYLLPCVYLGNVENLYEWDVTDLKPGTIYSGFTFSIDEGKTLFASSSLYGITKNEDGTMPSFDDAIHAKPIEGMPPLDLWSQDSAIAYMGEKLAKKTYSIMIKKHHEESNPDDYVSLNRAHEFKSEFDWLDDVEWAKFEKH